MSDAASQGAIGKAVRNYFHEFGALRSCGRTFWVVQAVNLLDGVAYFAMLTVSTLYLSETLGYSDAQAANLWAACMAVYTGMGFVAGFIGDSLGIKRTLHISVILLVVSRLAISATTDKSVVIPALFVIAIGTAIMTPILIAATKRFTTKKNQTAGFNLLYFLMNVGAFLGNILFDPLRGLEWGNRSIFMLGSLMSILCWVSILLFWRRGIDTADAQAKAGKSNGSDGGESAEEKSEKWEAPWTIAASVFRESAFWRFMLFLVVLIGVRLVFEHQYQIYPKYYQRTMADYAFGLSPGSGTDRQHLLDDLDHARRSAALDRAFASHERALSEKATITVREPGSRWQIVGTEHTWHLRMDGEQFSVYSSDPPIGLLNSINPFIICFGVILSTPIVGRFRLFNVLLFGVAISALSTVILTIHPIWFTSALGLSLSQGYRFIVISQIVVFSIGEAIWSPRLYEYTAAIAPKGREASYMGLSYLPMFFARFAEGPIAGQLLKRYCPPDIGAHLTTVSYTQSPQMMCLILAVLAISSPLLVLALRRIIQKEASIEI